MGKIKIKPNIRRALAFVMCAALALTLCVGLLALDASALSGGQRYNNVKLIPGGVPFGVKFSTEGVVVVGFCDIDSIPKTRNPAYLAGLRPKDIITEVNGKELEDAAALTRAVENCGGHEISLTYTRSGQQNQVKLVPAYSESEGKYKTGIWVRDSGAGIGTVTYVVPSSGEFGGLGHGICDSESGELIAMERGVVSDVKINAIKKGIAGTPGELKGYFGSDKCGALKSNTDCGVFGTFTKIPEGLGQAMPVGFRGEVKCGEAEILCTLDDGGRQSYKIEIESINKGAEGSKCFVIKVTDQKLIEKTGGIVQGMSGSPIIQNGKLVGAVTHVMINDPTVGYGIFIENMLNAAQMPMARAS